MDAFMLTGLNPCKEGLALAVIGGAGAPVSRLLEILWSPPARRGRESTFGTAGRGFIPGGGAGISRGGGGGGGVP